MSVYAALAEPHRREILDLLRHHDRSVSELVARLDLNQPGVSKHLKVLREAGLVAVRPEGRHRRYALRAAPLIEIEAWLTPYRRHWNPGLDAPDQPVEESP